MRIGQLKKLLDVFPGCSKKEIVMFLCILDMVFQLHSYRTHVSHMEEHPGEPAMYGLGRVCPKSSMRGWAKRLGVGVGRVAAPLRVQAGRNRMQTGRCPGARRDSPR